jgi:hypothetical protein
MKFTIEVYENEIGKVAALLGRPLQVTPLISQPRSSRANGPKPNTALKLIEGTGGPTARVLAFAKRTPAFNAAQARRELMDIRKDSFYSTLDRLTKQGILHTTKEAGARRVYHLSEVGKNMLGPE